VLLHRPGDTRPAIFADVILRWIFTIPFPPAAGLQIRERVSCNGDGHMFEGAAAAIVPRLDHRVVLSGCQCHIRIQFRAIYNVVQLVVNVDSHRGDTL
jgi:hypothetical protein